MTLIDSIVGRYRIVGRLGTGGMGTVYRAEHLLIGSPVAIKVLHAEMSVQREIVDRFFNEAKATTAIKHPGIVEVFDFGYMPSGHAYIVMELLDGMTLTERLVRDGGKMTEHDAAFYLSHVCDALAAAHAKGIVHRDLKPDNVFLVRDYTSPVGERCKLLDFGIAKLTHGRLGSAPTATKTGAVIGTPAYMSPEQCRGAGEINHRSDLYSLGCMLYELLFGRPPFDVVGAGEAMGAHLFITPEPLAERAPHISPATSALVARLLDKLPERRIQTAAELGELLHMVARGSGGRIALPAWSEDATTAPRHPPSSKPTTLSSAVSVVTTRLARGFGIRAGLGIVVALGVGALGTYGIAARVSRYAPTHAPLEHSDPPAPMPATNAPRSRALLEPVPGPAARTVTQSPHESVAPTREEPRVPNEPAPPPPVEPRAPQPQSVPHAQLTHAAQSQPTPHAPQSPAPHSPQSPAPRTPTPSSPSQPAPQPSPLLETDL